MEAFDRWTVKHYYRQEIVVINIKFTQSFSVRNKSVTTPACYRYLVYNINDTEFVDLLPDNIESSNFPKSIASYPGVERFPRTRTIETYIR